MQNVFVFNIGDFWIGVLPSIKKREIVRKLVIDVKLNKHYHTDQFGIEEQTHTDQVDDEGCSLQFYWNWAIQLLL